LLFRAFTDLESWKVSYQYELSALYQNVKPTLKNFNGYCVSNNICIVTNNGIWVSERLAVDLAMCRYFKVWCSLRLGIRNGTDGRTSIFCHICVHIHDSQACLKSSTIGRQRKSY